MTIEEAIHCMKSYVPDQGEYYRCFRCPYYGSNTQMIDAEQAWHRRLDEIKDEDRTA